MSVSAISKGVRMSPRKVSVVASLVRGRSVSDALTILEHTPRRAAAPVKKVIKSAQANAEHNHNYKPDTLFINQIAVTAGPRMTRWRKHGRGYKGVMNRFQRKTSQIKVLVDGEKREVKKPTAKTSAKEKK